MAVTVGRIEYIVGADGRVLQKETRDAARKAGKDGGKTYSDELVKSFRERFGKDSGFDKALGSHDTKVIEQFRRLGGFTSKAYATRFEKTVLPAFADTGKKLTALFNKMTAGGEIIDVTRTFKVGPELEQQLSRTLGLMRELQVAASIGAVDTKGLNADALARFADQIDETISSGNLELLTQQQLTHNRAMAEAADADHLAAIEAEQLRRAKHQLTGEEAELVMALEREVRITGKSIDRMRSVKFVLEEQLDLSEDLVDVTKERVAAEEALNQADLRHMQSKLENLAVDERAAAKYKKSAETRAARLQITLAEIDAEDKLAAKTLRKLDAQIQEITQGRDLLDLKKKERKAVAELVEQLEIQEDIRQEAAASAAKVNRDLLRAERSYDRQSRRLEETIRLQRIVGESYEELSGSILANEKAVTASEKALKKAAKALKESAQVGEEIVVVEEKLAKARTTATAAVEDQRTGLQQMIADRHHEIDALQELNATYVGYNAGLREFIDGQEKVSAKNRQTIADIDHLGVGLGTLTRGLRSGSGALGEIGTQTRFLTGWTRELREELDHVAIATNNAGSAFRRGGGNANFLGSAMDILGDKFKNFGKSSDLNPRIIVGLIAALGEPIAVLGSALGPALLAVGATAGAAVAGVGGLVSVFVTLNKEIDTLPPDLQDVAREFQGLKGAMSQLNLNFAAAAFKQMDGSFDRITDTVARLTPEFEDLGGSVGRVIRDFSKAISTGRGFDEIQHFLEISGPLFERIADIAGTFLLALATGFRRVQPMTDAFLDWLESLADSFDTFVQGPGFDEWLGNSMTIFSSLNGLLKATGALLDNLVTPEAVARTAAFIDNVAAFMPHLENIISFFGELDILGVVTGALVDFGEALEPLVPALEALASGFSAGFGAALTVVAGTLQAILTPIGQLLDLLDPGVLQAIGAALGFLAAGLLAVAAVKGLSKMVSAASDLVAQLSYLTPYGGKLDKVATGLGGIASKAAGVAAASVAVYAVADAIVKAIDNARGLDRMAADFVAAGTDFETAAEAIHVNFDGLDQDLDTVVARMGDLDNFWVYITALDAVGEEAVQAAKTLQKLDAPLADLARHDPSQAAERFASYAKSLGATGKEVLALLENTPEYKAVLEDLLIAQDGTATSQELIDAAMTGTIGSTKALTGVTENLTPEMQKAADAAKLHADALEVLKGRSVDALKGIEGVADGLTTLGSAFRDQEGAASAYEAAIDDVATALAENGNEWRLSEEAGRANRQTIRDLAESTLALASENYNLTGSAEDAAAAIQTGREEVIKALEGMDLGGLSAEEYADKLGLIPGDVTTLISANTAAGMEMADAFAKRLFELGLLKVDPTIEVDTTAPLAATAQVLAGMTDLEREKFIATIDADNNPALVATATAMSTMTDLELETFTPKIDADNTLALDMTNATTLFMTNLQSTTFIPKIDADNSGAKSKTKESSDALYNLDGSIFTPDINVNNSDAMGGISDVNNALSGIKDKTIYITTVQTTRFIQESLAGANLGASGMMLNSGARLIVAGEDGPEALVPLRRALSRVDPSVRALSAYAQGLTSNRVGGAPASNTGRSLVIESGAITIQGTLQPEATATNTVNRIAERLA